MYVFAASSKQRSEAILVRCVGYMHEVGPVEVTTREGHTGTTATHKPNISQIDRDIHKKSGSIVASNGNATPSEYEI